MSTRCETAGKYILPIFRSLVAKELVSTHHLIQIEAAKKLGSTQAAISQYVRAKRATAYVNQCGDVLPKLQLLAKIAARRLAKGEATWQDVSNDLCMRCRRCFVDAIDEQDGDYVI